MTASPAPLPPMSENLFSAARAAFLASATTLENVRRDFPEWHLGRPRYALWALDLDLAPVRAAMAAAARHLDGLLLEAYHRQPHVTVALCGFPAAAPQHRDDFGAAALAAQTRALEAAGLAPFEIEIGALASFTSAPFLAVHDPDGGIGRLRGALAGDAQAAGGPYTPHLTVGLYGGAWPTPAVQARLDAFAGGPPLRCRITRISLMSYAAPLIGGPLERLGEFEFNAAGGAWRDRAAAAQFLPHDAHPLPA